MGLRVFRLDRGVAGCSTIQRWGIWEPLDDTRGIACPEWVVDTVLDHVAKENKATGYDEVSETLWKRVKTARHICKVMLMWSLGV